MSSPREPRIAFGLKSVLEAYAIVLRLHEAPHNWPGPPHCPTRVAVVTGSRSTQTARAIGGHNHSRENCSATASPRHSLLDFNLHLPFLAATMPRKTRSKKSLRRVKSSKSVASRVGNAEPGPSATQSDPQAVAADFVSPPPPSALAEDPPEEGGDPYDDVARNYGLTGEDAAEFVAHNTGIDRYKTPPVSLHASEPPDSPSHSGEQPASKPEEAEPGSDMPTAQEIFQRPEADGDKGPSPLRPGPDSWVLSDHTLMSVRPYVIRDLAEAHHTSVEMWLDTHLGISADQFHQWSDTIAKERFFYDKEVQDALFKYCSANSEAERYKPFIDLCTRIVTMARGVLPLAGKDGNTYPLDDLVFVNNHKRNIQTIPEHEGVAAERRPDIIVVRKTADPTVTKQRAKWSDLLTWCEMKVIAKIAPKLDLAREERGFSSTETKSGTSVDASTSDRATTVSCLLM